MKQLWINPDRLGIRARLLTLLLPVILSLLAFDSWNDYRALKSLVQDAYDQAMLEPVKALQTSLSIAPDGSLQLNTPFVVQAMFDATRPQHKHLHVGLTPLQPDKKLPEDAASATSAGGEINLLGEADLPLPPVSAVKELSVSDPPDASPGQYSRSWYDSSYRGYPVRVLAVQGEVVDGHGKRFGLMIQAAESTGPREQAQAACLRQELLRDIRMLLAVIVLVWLGVTWSLQPLERLRKSVLKRKGQLLSPHDTSDVPHEVAPLVDTLVEHLASYRDLLDQQSRFLADASHQLRTPLAIMLTQAGVALREKNPAQLRETLRAMVTQIVRSRRLCEQLLSLAHASDSAHAENAPALVDLNTIARDVVLQYLTLAHEKNQDLGWVGAPGDKPGDVLPSAYSSTPHPVSVTATAALVVPVMAVSAELHEALANLLYNAIVYTPSGGHITVMVSTQDNKALAEVRDDGPGITQARRTTVFERFNHAAPEAGKDKHGAGLGLAIARAYAKRNGGDIELADLAEEFASNIDSRGTATGSQGLRAILSLPLASGQQPDRQA